MQVILQKTPALMVTCEQCGALLAYQFNDIYQGHFIYCPVCKFKQIIPLDNNYDGVVKNGKNAN